MVDFIKNSFGRVHKIIWAILAVTPILLSAMTAQAAPIFIDTFDTDTHSADAVTNGVPVCSSLAGTDMVGLSRDIRVTRTSGSGTARAAVNNDVPGSYAFSLGAGTGGTALVQWDGNDGSCALNPTGLGGINLNPNDGLSLWIQTVDLNASVTMRIYTTGSDFSSLTYVVPRAVTSPGYAAFFPFSNFTPTGAGANFNSVGAIEISISGPSGVDMVLDYVNSDFTRDLGDLPTAYNNTLVADNGARHIVGDIYLGSVVDTEADGQESADATGDLAREDDENGITPDALSWGSGSASLTVDITKPDAALLACVVGWIDWDQDNVFELTSSIGGKSELVMNTFLTADGSVSITTPTTAEYGGAYPATLNGRFRIFQRNDPLFSAVDGFGCPTAAAAMALVFGQAQNGEVEDYQWGFSPTAVTLRETAATDSQTAGVMVPVAVLVLGLVTAIFGLISWRRKFS